MLIIYLSFVLLLLPCIFIKRRQANNKSQLLDRNDTNVIRGISALFVVSAHYSVWLNHLIDNSMHSIVRIPLEQFGGIGVLLFFFVSGFGINESYGKNNRISGYISKRFSGVYIPYVLIKFLCITVMLICHVMDDSVRVILLYLQVFAVPDWFVFVIILQYAVYYLSMKLCKNHIVLFGITADILMSIVFIFSNKPIGWFNALWLFTFGVAVSYNSEKITGLINRYTKRVMILSFLGFVVFGVLFVLTKGYPWANIFKPLSGCFLSVFTIYIFKLVSADNRILVWCGKRSLYIYIVHIAVWDVSYYYIKNPILLIWVAIIATFIMTWITHIVVSRAVEIVKEKALKD